MMTKKHLAASAIMATMSVLAFLLTGCLDRNRTPASRIYYHGPRSDHFDGAHFFNPDGEQGNGGAQRDGIGAFLGVADGTRGHHDWPKAVPVRQSVPPRRVAGQKMLVTWIGHATVLVQTQGVNILVDPVWAWRDSPIQFVGPRRVREPGVKLEDLPPIDLVLISHNHYDHLDIGALKQIALRDHPLIVTGLGNDTLLAEHGLTAIARDWGQSVPLRPDISIRVERAHHWSAHWYDDKDRALWCGFRVMLPGGDLYFAGDTGEGKMAWAHEVAKDGRPIRLALLPIAPYKVKSAPSGNHIDPGQAVAAFRILKPDYALAIHWGTFELGEEGVDDAPKALQAALLRAAIGSDRFRALDAGQSWDIPEARD